MPRDYVMRKRADAHRRTRERILQATMSLHDEKGVAPTTYADIARRAGVGQATMSRHFPTIGDLVAACGVHVWQEMRPPTSEEAPAAFQGLTEPRQRLERLVEVLDAFYRRGELRLGLATRDRELIPELDGFLKAVEAGVAAHVTAALAGRNVGDRAVAAVSALVSFPVWSSLARRGLADDAAFMTRLIECAIAGAEAAKDGTRNRDRQSQD